MKVDQVEFEWDEDKDTANRLKHGVGFDLAQMAFTDPFRIIRPDLEHSDEENRYFCFGLVDGKVLSVRFTYRDGKIRIFGAGYWRKGKATYHGNRDSLH